MRINIKHNQLQILDIPSVITFSAEKKTHESWYLDLLSLKMHHQNPADAPPEPDGTTRIRHTPTESCLHLQREYVEVLKNYS